MRNQLYIDGQWVSAAKGSTFDVVNPATEEVIHHAPAGTAEDVDLAVRAARRGRLAQAVGRAACRIPPCHR